MNKRFWKALLAVGCVVGLVSQVTPAYAQANYYRSGTRTSGLNGCHVEWYHENVNTNLYAYERSVNGYVPDCTVEIKVSYWDVYGTWIIWDSGWVHTPSDNVQSPISPNLHQAIWWVDYNSKAPGSSIAYGFRDYAPGCNSSGC